MKDQHTYLLEPGKWNAQGKWYDRNGESVGLEGTTTITHGEQVWEHRGNLRLLRPVPVEFENIYEVKPLVASADMEEQEPPTMQNEVETQIATALLGTGTGTEQPVAAQTEWTSVNRSIGRLSGRYALAKGSILSIARSESGYHKTFEYLRRVNKDIYHSRGALFVGENMVSSWAMVLRREQ